MRIEPGVVGGVELFFQSPAILDFLLQSPAMLDFLLQSPVMLDFLLPDKLD